MACKVERLGGKIDRVLSPTGETSKLFNDIASLPFINDLENALESYKNIYTEEVSVEPYLDFISDKGNFFTSYREALIDSQGGNIDVKIGDRTIFKVSSNTNVNTPEGFKNYYIKAGLMSDVRLIENGQSFLQAEGLSDDVKAVNEFIIDEDAKSSIGTANRTITQDGKITIRDVKGKILLSNGDIEKISSFNNMSNEEILLKYPQDASQIMVSKAIKEDILDNTFGTTRESDVQIKLSEKELQTRLLTLLEKMGVKVTTIDKYLTNSKKVNNVEVSANALADIENQIIALKNGEIDTDALTEETAHFIVEAWNENDISDLLRNVDKTEEYIEFASRYREIYSKDNTKEEAENLVRKEVLGKILAKSLVSNFSIENKTASQVSIIEYIKNLFSDFMEQVKTLFKPQDEIDLINFTNQVNDLLMNQNINSYLNLQQLNNKKFVMYQVSPNSGNEQVDGILMQSKNLLKVLQKQAKDLLKAGKGLTIDSKKLKTLEQRIDEAEISESIASFLSVAARQTKYINEAAEKAKVNKAFLSHEEGIVYHSLKNNMAPALSEIKDYLVRENKPGNKTIIDNITNVIGEVSDIEGKIKTQGNDILNTIVDRMIQRHNLPESIRQMVMDATQAAVNDTTAFYATFGQLTHARDPLLNITGTLISDMTIEANQGFLGTAKPFQEQIRETGHTEKDLKQLIDNGYLTSIVDYNAFNKKREEISASIIKRILNSPLSVEQIVEYQKSPNKTKLKEEELPKLFTAEQNDQYDKEFKLEMLPFQEKVFTEQYYIDEQKKYEDYNISDASVRVRRSLSESRGVLLSRVKTIDGKTRYTKENKIDMITLDLERKKLKSFVNKFGVNKKGITIIDGILENPINEDSIEINGKIIEIDRSIADEEATIAFDLNKLDLIYQQELNGGERIKNESLSPEFLQELSRIESEEGREQALEFFRFNASVNFSEEYWNSMGERETIAEQLSNSENEEAPLVSYMLNESLNQRKQILKQYKSTQDPSNTLVGEIPMEVRDQILRLSEDVDTSFLQASKILGDNRTDEEIISVSENTPNQEYYEHTQGYSVRDKIEFILNNTTQSNKRRINEFDYALSALSKGKEISSSKKAVYDRFNTGDREQTLLAYAESKIAPYYQRFAPIGYNELQSRLENSQESVSGVVNEMNNNNNLTLTNNYSYYQAEEQTYKNPNYKQNYEGGYFQPKISEFRNEHFNNLFDPVIENGEVTRVNKNQKLFDLYNATIKYHKDNLALTGELGKHNLYKLPQISKSEMNKISDFINKKNKGATVKESVKDFLFYRVDDKAYGEVTNSGEKVIPKYYLHDLENPQDVSDDVFASLTAFGQQAHLYQARKNAYSDLMAVQEAILKRSYPNGKQAEATDTVKMFRSFMNYNLFGVQESKQLTATLPIIGKVDLTKNIRFFNKWVVNRGLGLNPVVAFTSYLTGEVQIQTEKYIGEYLNPFSTNLAFAEFKKLAPAAVKSMMEINSRDPLTVLMEYTGIADIENRYKNSIYSKTLRTLPKLSMFLNQAANFPIIPKVMLSVLYDNRMVGDQIMNYEEFKRISTGSVKETNEQWKALENKSFYSYMNISPTGVLYDVQRMKADLNSTLSDEDFTDFIKNKEKGVLAKVREIAKRVDGQIPQQEKSLAQRHYFLSIFTLYKGWMGIAYANRFKNRHLNFQTGILEEGSYRTAGDFISKTFSGLYKNGFKTFLKDVKQQWMEGGELERRNIKRVSIEMAFLQGVIAIGWMLAQIADDDDNKDLYSLQLSNYMFTRLSNETNSANLGVLGEFYNTVQAPIVGAQTLKSIFNLSDYYDIATNPTEKIERGRYAGNYKFEKKLIDLTPGYGSFVNLANPRDAVNSYNHFNTGVADFNPIVFLLNSQTEK